MKYSTLARIRRITQAVFLALFLFLLLQTEFKGSLRALPADIRLPYPVGIFLQADPLLAVSNALATRSLYRGLLWSLVILIPTFFLGRVFCGWVCPLGTLNHFFGSLESESKLGKKRLESNRYRSWQRWKYYVLAALLVAALFGSALLLVLDPISLLVRSIGLSALPAANYAVNAALEWLYATDVPILRFAAEAIQFVCRYVLLSFREPHFRQALLLGLILIAILALNLPITRFWCRALCPLGALLGLASRWSILNLRKSPEACDGCNRCLLHCQGGDDPVPKAAWRKPECHVCLNCAAECPKGSLRFGWFGAPEGAMGPNLQRRKAIAGLAAGAALVPVLRAGTAASSETHDRLIRPPGAVDERAFLARCIRCGECIKACPNNALHPALAQGGLEGLWTPVLVPRTGYCEPSCTLCSQVCPTGAIWEITAQEKGWVRERAGDSKPVRIGTAFYDHGRCLPWAMATECIVCEEWCPTSPKAVYLRPADVVDGQGAVKHVRQPYMDPQKCIGCGACEYACPVHDRPAVYVTSIGETRSRTNQILLERRRRA